jgi:dTDP-glucose 4,6-dehydratase
MARKLTNILVTGGAGFIGSNFIHYLFAQDDFAGRIINLDALTYAGNLENLVDIDRAYGGRRYFFEHGDIQDRRLVEALFNTYDIDTVVNFAAESHVDRSILGPEAFLKTNIMGTYTLLDVARNAWKSRDDVLFHHISTDEVYGSLGDTGFFTETTSYDPRSPYSASKASSDHLVRAYYHTYGLPITLSNCSNNYGPYQFPEKFIPLMILNMLDGKLLPVYGDGKNIRDWIYVEDHNAAVWLIMNKGIMGESYNIGGENELANIDVLMNLVTIISTKIDKNKKELENSIIYIRDRPGHDRRYAIDCSKLKSELGWKRNVNFRQGLEITIDWYLANRGWIDRVKNGEYKDWIKRNY